MIILLALAVAGICSPDSWNGVCSSANWSAYHAKIDRVMGVKK